MENMPNLKLVHPRGVAYNAIDTEAAKRLGVTVCNNAGVNASGVAEQTVLLMLACLRDAVNADAAVRRGAQIETKERMMVEGIRELGDCTVGFIGFGAIAQATAKRLAGWGCPMLYNKGTASPSTSKPPSASSSPSIDDIARTCDIVSIHVPSPTTRAAWSTTSSSRT